MFDVSKVKGFAEMFPALMEVRKTNETPCYDQQGNLCELTEADKSMIAKLNDKGFDVWFVVNSIVNVGVALPMTSYAILGKEDGPYSEDNDSCIMVEDDYAYVLCNVANSTWDIEEMGSIVIREQNDKLVRLG